MLSIAPLKKEKKKIPKIYWLKTNVYYPTVFVGLESRCPLPGVQCLSLYWNYGQFVGWDISHLRTQLGIKNMLPSSFTCLLANIRRSASKLINFTFPQGCLTAWQPVSCSQWSKREWDSGQSFYSLTSEVASFYISHILFIRNKSIGQMHVGIPSSKSGLDVEEVAWWLFLKYSSSCEISF